MRVRRQVERHVVLVYGEVSAVIEVEAAQEILVRLPAPRVLGDDDTGDGLQYLSHTKDGALLKLCCAHRSLSGGRSDADHAVLPPGDDYFGQARDLVGIDIS